MEALTTLTAGASDAGVQLVIEGVRGPGEGIHDPEPLHHPEPGELELAAVLHALSDPMRLRIVMALADGGEHNCKSFDMPITKSTCTHHFKVLREAGVTRQRLLGTTRLNSLRRDDLDERFPGLLDAVLAGATTVAAPAR
jgi:DNA-binding transcriptional ArsR family regulator